MPGLCTVDKSINTGTFGRDTRYQSLIPSKRKKLTLNSTHNSMVMELAAGDLQDQYEEKGDRTFSFPIGLKIMIGAALGLAHMHTMPEPMIHRDIKSINIMVMPDGETGKLGDCGESRRVVSSIGGSTDDGALT